MEDSDTPSNDIDFEAVMREYDEAFPSQAEPKPMTEADFTAEMDRQYRETLADPTQFDFAERWQAANEQIEQMRQAEYLRQSEEDGRLARQHIREQLGDLEGRFTESQLDHFLQSHFLTNERIQRGWADRYSNQIGFRNSLKQVVRAARAEIESWPDPLATETRNDVVAAVKGGAHGGRSGFGELPDLKNMSNEQFWSYKQGLTKGAT